MSQLVGLAAADEDGGQDEQLAVGSPGALEEALGAVIAERVREFRLHLGLTVGQLAELTSLSKGMLSKIENGSISPSLATLHSLSTALNIPISRLFGEREEQRDCSFVKAGHGVRIERRGARSSACPSGSRSSAHRARCPDRSSALEPMTTYRLVAVRP